MVVLDCYKVIVDFYGSEDSRNWPTIKDFCKKRKWIKNMRKWTLNLRNQINKLGFLKFLKKAETGTKYEETDLKFEETNQQIESFKKS